MRNCENCYHFHMIILSDGTNIITQANKPPIIIKSYRVKE